MCNKEVPPSLVALQDQVWAMLDDMVDDIERISKMPSDQLSDDDELIFQCALTALAGILLQRRGERALLDGVDD